MTTLSQPRRWYALYLLFVGAVITYFAFHHLRNLSQFCIGDYLINYTAGFVRRGLPGEVIFLTARLLHLGVSSLPMLAFILQVIIFTSLLYFIFVLTRGVRLTFALTALLLSPATLSFGLLNPSEGMRKEILLYAVLAGFCLPAMARLRPWQTILLLTIAAPALVLSHELATTCMPYLFLVAALQLGGPARSWKLLLLPAATTLAAVIAVVLHPGNQAIAQGVCSSIGHTLHAFDSGDTGVCGGAIVWLTLTPAQARGNTLAMIGSFHYYRAYGLYLIPTFAPALLVLYSLFKHPATRHLAKLISVAAVLSSIASLILFYSAFDYGRWEAIHVTCFMIVLLYASRMVPAEPASVPPRKSLRIAATVAVALYATAWALPPVAPPIRNTRGYIGLYLYYRDVHLKNPGNPTKV